MSLSVKQVRGSCVGAVSGFSSTFGFTEGAGTSLSSYREAERAVLIRCLLGTEKITHL